MLQGRSLLPVTERSEISRSPQRSVRVATIIGLCAIVSLQLITRIHHSHEPVGEQRQSTNPLVADPAVDRWESAGGVAGSASMTPAVEYKYRYLLADLRASGQDVFGVEQLLQARELAVSEEISESASEQAEIDQQLRGLLHPADYATYEHLRDSDEEQRRLSDYAGGLAHVAPLDAQQERAVLEAKLRHKSRYVAMLRSAGANRSALTAQERTYGFETAAAGLLEYHETFLRDVSSVLGDDQLVALRDYESTEMERELARLQSRMNDAMAQVQF